MFVGSVKLYKTVFIDKAFNYPRGSKLVDEKARYAYRILQKYESLAIGDSF